MNGIKSSQKQGGSPLKKMPNAQKKVKQRFSVLLWYALWLGRFVAIKARRGSRFGGSFAAAASSSKSQPPVKCRGEIWRVGDVLCFFLGRFRGGWFLGCSFLVWLVKNMIYYSILQPIAYSHEGFLFWSQARWSFDGFVRFHGTALLRVESQCGTDNLIFDYPGFRFHTDRLQASDSMLDGWRLFQSFFNSNVFMIWSSSQRKLGYSQHSRPVKSNPETPNVCHCFWWLFRCWRNPGCDSLGSNRRLLERSVYLSPRWITTRHKGPGQNTKSTTPPTCCLGALSRLGFGLAQLVGFQA